MKLVYKRFVSVGETLAQYRRNCGNILKLAQRWANGDSHTMMMEQNKNLEITNINQNMYI